MMRQALHIFKKDVRGLAFEIAVVVLLIAVFAGADSFPYVTEGQYRNSARWASILRLLLPLSWCFLAARVIQAEALPGDRQFWVTRPYSRVSLLAAKMLFLLAFVSVPMIISDVVSLHGQGFSVAGNLPGILWEMLLRFGTILFPAMIIACFTRNIGAFTMLSLVTAMAFIFDAGFRAGAGLNAANWVPDALASALIPMVIVLQYARRMRIAIGLAIFAWVFPTLSARVWRQDIQTIQYAVSKDAPKLQFELDPHPKRIFFPRSEYKDDEVPIALPILIANLPEGLVARATQSQVIARWTLDGLRWRGNPGGSQASFTPDRSVPDPRFFWLEVKVPSQLYEYAEEKGQKLALNLFFDVMLYKDFREEDLDNHKDGSDFAMPGFGYCRVPTVNRVLSCRRPFKHPSVDFMAYDAEGDTLSNGSFALEPTLLPAEFGISPIIYFNLWIDPKQTTIATGEPVSHIEQSVDLPPVRLKDYAEIRPKK